MEFPVIQRGRRRMVRCRFGTLADLPRLAAWRTVVKGTPPGIQHDAAEFAGLACKRWRYYRRQGASAVSLEGLKALLAIQPDAELALLLLVEADWFNRSEALGFCHCRRTWCNHLFVDFLGTHPASSLPAGRVSGLGTGLLFQAALIARELGAARIWGEATRTSASFYERVLGQTPVLDLFTLSAEQREQFIVRCEARWFPAGKQA